MQWRQGRHQRQHIYRQKAASSLVDVDDLAEVTLLVLGGVDGLGDMPGHGRVIKVFVNVVHDATRHALEELRHTLAPAAGLAPAPGSVVEHLATALDVVDKGVASHPAITQKRGQSCQKRPQKPYLTSTSMRQKVQPQSSSAHYLRLSALPCSSTRPAPDVSRPGGCSCCATLTVVAQGSAKRHLMQTPQRRE